MEKFASADMTAGELSEIVEKLGGTEGARKFLRGELTVSEPIRNWREEDGVIYFSVTSDGTTGPQWIERLQGKGFRISDNARSVLLSKSFQPTDGVTTEVAVLKGRLFKDNERITKNIRTEAANRTLKTPNAEIGCLIREKFTHKNIKAMGLVWIVAMHEPIEDSNGYPSFFSTDVVHLKHGLSTDYDDHGRRTWFHVTGFAFAVSQVQVSAQISPLD